MAVYYSSNKLGTITVVQQKQNAKGESVPQKFNIQIRQGENCLAVFLYVYKHPTPTDPKRPWVHQFLGYFNDDKHIKSYVGSKKENAFACLFNADSIKKVKLNLYYKQSNILLKYMVRDGLKVECYYKEEK